MYYCIHFFCVIRKCSYKHLIYIYKHLIIYSTFAAMSEDMRKPAEPTKLPSWCEVKPSMDTRKPAEPNKPPSWRVVKPPTAEDRKVLKRGVVVLPPGSVKQRRQQEPHKHHANQKAEPENKNDDEPDKDESDKEQELKPIKGRRRKKQCTL